MFFDDPWARYWSPNLASYVNVFIRFSSQFEDSQSFAVARKYSFHWQKKWTWDIDSVLVAQGKSMCDIKHHFLFTSFYAFPSSLSSAEAPPNMAPKSSQKSIVEVSVDRGSKVHLPCNIQGNPLPIFTWYRLSDSGSYYSVPSSQRIVPSQTLLLIRNVDDRDAGRWVIYCLWQFSLALDTSIYAWLNLLLLAPLQICKASNQYGELKLEIILRVYSYLTAHMSPQHQIVNSNAAGIFNCSISGSTDAHTEWFHNGKSIINEDVQGSSK